MSKIKESIKRNKNLYRYLLWFYKPVSRLLAVFQFIRGYYSDLRLNLKYSMSMSKERAACIKSRILMIVHFLEKGMSYKKPRPFGIGYVVDLMKNLELICETESSCFEYEVGISILRQWIRVFEQHGWTDEPLLERVRSFLNDKKPNNIQVGAYEVIEGISTSKSSQCENGACLLSRKSIRDFTSEVLDEKDLAFALDCFRVSPSACNRQPCKLYYIKNGDLRELLNNTVPGVGGLNKETLNYFIVTFDIAALYNGKERNQGFFNAGLAAMNFVSGLNCSGIGSCFLQWDLLERHDARVRKALGLPVSERIAVVIAAGHKKNHYTVTVSARKPLKDLYREIV